MANKKRETTEVRQLQITEAALQIIGKKGMSGATTAEIAVAAGISEGNIYRHFKSKEEIILSVIDKIGRDLESLLKTSPDIAGPVQKLEQIFKRHLSYIGQNVGIPRTIFSEEVLVLNANFRIKAHQNISRYSQGICAIITQGQETGLINQKLDPNAVTSMFIGTINFTTIKWFMNDSPPSLTSEGEILWRTFITAITTNS